MYSKCQFGEVRLSELEALDPHEHSRLLEYARDVEAWAAVLIHDIETGCPINVERQLEALEMESAALRVAMRSAEDRVLGSESPRLPSDLLEAPGADPR